ncbi:MAG TPA: 2-deoxyribose-5-phosphate aldolase, partial [Calditrichaeota bacterium]|nr:2-deoxyribose-5-phosphate aldolase [Calditrichota bacterium]
MTAITPQVIEQIISQVVAEANLRDVRPFSYDAANDLISFGASRVGAVAPSCPPKYELARWIDHTLLKPDATKADVEKICKEAVENYFASVCINPTWVPLAYRLLRASQTRVCTVVGFP